MNLSEAHADQIRRDCEHVFLQVAHLTDHGPQQNIAELFTPEGEVDRDGNVIRGRPALRDMYGKRAPNLMTRHLVANLVVTPLSASEASCRAYATVYRVRGSGPQPPTPPVTCAGPESIVEYEDRLAHTDEGWRIERRVMRTVIEVKSQA